MSVIEVKPFCHEAEVAVTGGVLRMVINFRAIDRLEGLLGEGMDELLGRLATSQSMMVKFLWGVTRDHHSDLDMDQMAGLLLSAEHGAAVAATLGDLVRRAFHIGADAEGEQSRPPRKRSSGASRASSRNGSRPVSGQRTSGRKHRAVS